MKVLKRMPTLLGSVAATVLTIGLLTTPAASQTREWVRMLHPSTGINSDCDTPLFQMPAPLPADSHFDFIGLYDPDAPADGPQRDAIPLTPEDCQTSLDRLVATTSNAAFRAENGFPDPDSRLKNLRSHEVPKPAGPDGSRLFLPPEGTLPPPLPPSNSLPNVPLSLGAFRAVSGSLHLSCFDDGTADVRIELAGYTPNEILTVWAIWLTTPPGAPGPTSLPLPFGGTPNVVIPDATGAAIFERELGYCPLDPAPDGSQLVVIDIAAHWDGGAYGAIPDVPLSEATFLPDPADPSSAFNSVIGAGIVTVNRGVIPMSVLAATDGLRINEDCNGDQIVNGADLIGAGCP